MTRSRLRAAAPRSATRIRRGPTWRRQLVLAPLAAVWLIPVVMVLGLSLLPAGNPSVTALGMVPAEPTLANFATIWTQNPMLAHLTNSLLITVPTVVLVLLLGSMAAFALARLRVPLKPVWFGILLLALVLPMPSIVVALFQILRALGLYDSLVGLVLAYTALGLPFGVIIIRAGFRAVPAELHQAAQLDGASDVQIYARVYLPLVKPSAAVVTIWTFMLTWNDFLLPLVAISENLRKPLTLLPLAYRGMYLSEPGALFAILVLISVPVVIVFAAVQRFLVRGLAGAVK